MRYAKYYKCYNKERYEENQEYSIKNIIKYYNWKHNKDSAINNTGYTDLMKYENNIRLFYMNTRGFDSDTYEIIMMLK